MSKYPFNEIEKKWQRYWEEKKTFKVDENPSVPKEKRLYVLDMFPYPSSQGLHVGHPEGYTASDIYSRFQRMRGYHVLHPMGFDSFGLPAENYAIKTGTHPKETTEENIRLFIDQIKSLGFSYDWDRMVSTHEPDYYKWTQWIFLQIYKQGLAYEAQTPINWCPSCKTGLANEEVKEGTCDRCGTEVTHKDIRQWVLKITDYADKLLEGLDGLDWSDSIKTMQYNWIGRSEGAEVTFELEDGSESFFVYTTRPDTLFGATYMVLAPEHPLVDQVTTEDRKEKVHEYLDEAKKKSDLERTDLAKDKSGVFSGSYAINPVNGKKIPIWIADYVLISYGSGAIMAVPAHDQRDWEFATKFGLPIIEVLKGGDVEKEAFTEDGPHVNSEFLDGLGKEEAVEKMIQWLEKEGLGRRATNYKLRDWIFSRQRYWGEPIPIVHCETCGTVPVPEKELPLTLPEVDTYQPTGTGESPLATIEEWVHTECPKCGGPGRRETNTMPQWAGSCWYYLRYLDPHNDRAFADKGKVDYWMPVDLYIGGAEHAVLHLLYARFWHKVLYDIGAVGTPEPFQRLVNQGMILGEGGVKMSKSLGNVINPDDIIRDYGADSMRVYEMFMGPLQVSKAWSTNGLAGVHRFLDRVWRVAERPVSEEEPTKEQLKLLHKTIKKVTEDTEQLEFNTAISQMMIFINEIFALERIPRRLWEPFVQLISPYAPHLGEELWERLGNKPSVSNTIWPFWEEELTKEEEVTVVIQVNGKVREKLDLPAGTEEERMKKMALESEKIQKWIDGKELVKVITVPDKLVNIVVK